MATVICHFYNEEILLPYWLKHHYPLFDHGIMINYASTDESLNIIGELAPTWEIRDSQNKMFGAADCDNEVMAIERELAGWKIALSATEFLLPPRDGMKPALKLFEQKWPNLAGFTCQGVQIFNTPEQQFRSFTEESLLFQYTNGFIEDENTMPTRCRLMHRSEDGRYNLGRHSTKHNVPRATDMFVVWFGALIELRKHRYRMHKPRIPIEQKQAGTAYQYFWTDEDHEKAWKNELRYCYNLMEVENYRKAIEGLYYE